MEAGNIDLTKGSINKGLIKFSIPLLLSALLQQLYTTADLLIVGRYGSDIDMAAVGSTGAVTNLIVALFIGLSTGVSVLTAQYYSGGQRKKLTNVVHTNFAIAIYGGLILTIFTYIFAPAMLRMMGTPEDIMEGAVIYMRIFFLGIVPIMVYNMGSGVLRSVGDSQRPFNFLAISAILNIILDLFFVAKLQWGALGAGVATAVAQSASGILTIYSLVKSTEIYRLSLRKIRFHWESFKEIFYIGFPASIQSALISISNVFVQVKINSFGPAAIAGSAASSRVEGFVLTAITALSLSATTFSAQNFGARKIERIRKGVISINIMSLVLSLVIGFSGYVMRKDIVALFNSNPEVIEYGQRFLSYMLPWFWMLGISNILSGFIQGSGTSIPPMVISTVTLFGIRLAWIIIMLPIHHSMDTIAASYPVTWTANTILFIIYYRYGKWRDVAIERMERLSRMDD